MAAPLCLVARPQLFSVPQPLPLVPAPAGQLTPKTQTQGQHHAKGFGGGRDKHAVTKEKQGHDLALC